MPRELSAGDQGPDVQALQEALHNVLGRKAKNNRRGQYGSLTVRDVSLYKSAWTTKRDGHVAGSLVWDHLARDGAIKARQQRLLKQAATQEVERQHESAETRIRRMIVAEANWMLANRGRYVYHQYRPYPSSLRSDEARDRLDCSSSCTLWFKGGGAPDPNGRGFDGAGYTGTLWARGTPVGVPAPTDLCFYGSMGAVFGHVPSHVAMCVEPGWVVSFGHTPVSKYPVRYRSDYRGARRYSAV